MCPLKEKSQKRCEEEGTEMLRNLFSFCTTMVGRTGRGAPELEAYLTTIISIKSVHTGSGTPEEVVTKRMQASITFLYEQAHVEVQKSRCPLLKGFSTARQLAAYEDLWRRIAECDWSLAPSIRPVVYCLVVDIRDNIHSFDSYFSALYHATVFDLRRNPHENARWGIVAFRSYGFHASYYEVDFGEETDRKIIRQSIDRLSAWPIVLITSHRQSEMLSLLTEAFQDVEFLFIS